MMDAVKSQPSTSARKYELAESKVAQVLIADSAPIQSQLLARALQSRREFQVSAVALESSAIDAFLQANQTDVLLLAGNNLPDFTLLRWLRVSHPRVAPVLLAESDDRELW